MHICDHRDETRGHRGGGSVFALYRNGEPCGFCEKPGRWFLPPPEKLHTDPVPRAGTVQPTAWFKSRLLILVVLSLGATPFPFLSLGFCTCEVGDRALPKREVPRAPPARRGVCIPYVLTATASAHGAG